MSAPTTTVSSTELRDRLGSSAPPRLLDVRTPGEFETAHIAGAYNVPLDVVRERRSEIIDRLNGDVVFVCRSGQRAAQAEELLRNEGLTQGSVLTGGITDWQSNGFEVDRGKQRWDLERQVRLVAGSIVLSSVLGSVAIPRLKWLAAGNRWRPDLRSGEQHLRDGHGVVQAALQPHGHVRCSEDRVPTRRFRCCRRLRRYRHSETLTGTAQYVVATEGPVNPASIRTPPPTRVVVVGGGFSGAMTAVNIARLSEEPLQVTVVNEGRPVGRGVAYGLRRPEYLLNVAARNMSAFPDEPDHFLDWLRTRTEFASTPEIELREQFISRQIYGDYVCSLVLHHLQNPGGTTPVSTECVIGEVVDIEPEEPGCAVRLADGSALDADRVVLATGNEAPAALPGAPTLVGHPAWVGNPWQAWEDRLPQQDRSIVILGTGLTTVDAIITLRALGWMGSIHAVSRHGWFPHPHFRGVEYPDFPPADVDLAALGLDQLLALIHRHCAVLREQDANPAIIVDKLRPHTQRIWSQFTRQERLTFAKEHAARWNVFRHRISPDIHSQITNSQLTGQLRVHAGSIVKLEASQDRILVHLEDGQALAGDLVLNATGPSTRFTATRSVLLQNLLRRGAVAADDTDMGVRVDPDHTVLTSEGHRSPWLLALGPVLRGTYWETIAVPELRVQARHVAETLLGSTRLDDEVRQLQLEYMI